MPRRLLQLGLVLCIAYSGRPGAFAAPIPSDLLQADCPATELGETMEDCPWADAARLMIVTAEVGAPVGPSLAGLLPQLQHQLETDARKDFWKDLWTKSINYDELAQGTIVHPAILDSMAGTLSVAPREDRIVHAGMEHTYGYLFSVLKTSFGYKRARWVRDDIEEGFGLPRNTLGPLTKQGTLLANVTLFAGKIALADDARARGALSGKAVAHVAETIRSFDFGSLSRTRLEEKLVLKDGSGERTVTLRTDFVPFTHVVAGKANTHLLVYSVADSRVEGARLVTVFPVEASFVQRALNTAELGEDKPIVTRYNAFVEGVTGTSGLRGTRRVL